MMTAFVVRLQRHCYADVEIDADSPSEATMGVLQEAIAGTVPDELWILPPLMPNTVKPIGSPRELGPASRLQGREAFTTEPEKPPINLDDLPDGAEIPEELLDGVVDHDGEIVEDVDSPVTLGDDVPDLSEEILEYLMMEEAVDQKRLNGTMITDDEYGALRGLRAMLITGLTPPDDDEAVEAPATDVPQAG